MQPNDGLFKTGLLVCWMAIAGLAVTYPAGAQTPDPVPVPVPGDTGTEGKKLKPIVIRVLQDLAFGSYVAGNTIGGQISINPETGRKSALGAFTAGGDHSRGEYEITGEPNQRFVVTLPATGFNLAGQQNQGPQLHRFSVYIVSGAAHGNPRGAVDPGSGNRVTGTLGPDGKATLYLGGTLVTRPGNRGGFNSSFDFFVDYLP